MRWKLNGLHIKESTYQISDFVEKFLSVALSGGLVPHDFVLDQFELKTKIKNEDKK